MADHQTNTRAPLPRIDNPPGEGVVVVPVEPTQAMVEAGNRELFRWVSPGLHSAEAYRAMLEAAPRPAAPGDGEVEAIVSEIASIIREDASIDIHFDITNADDLARSIVSRALAPPVQARDDGEAMRLREAMREACDLLAERTHGSPARSPCHNARLRLEAALAPSAARDEQTGGGR